MSNEKKGTPFTGPDGLPLKEKKQQIAIMGGSFNPLTTGHLQLAQAVLNALPQLDRVWLMPAYRHPFEKHTAYSGHRIQMLRMVETDRIRYFGYEIDHRLSGITYDTFSKLSDDPDFSRYYNFYMIIGSDCLLDFDNRWQYAGLLARRVKFIIVPRPGYPVSNYNGLLSKPPHTILQNVVMPDISATLVRNRIREGLSITGLVPAPIEEHIFKNQLYSDFHQ